MSKIMNWLTGALATIFLSILDGLAYLLLSVSYNIFYAVSQLDIFGGTSAGQTLYEGITSRIYTVLSIVMVFVFAYQLIMMIADPDGKAKEGASHLIKDTLISIVLVIVLPLIFKYMSLFQYHVLENNTIPAIILGTNGGNSEKTPGKNIAMMVLTSFYHPNGTSYNTFFDENGKVRGDAYDACLSETAAEDGEEHPKTCEEYVKELTTWETSNSGSNGLKSLVWNSTLKGYIFDTMTYTFILSTVAALAAAWMFLCYALDVGVRAVKLGVLQLISPIPVILKIFPQTKKSYEKWFFQIKKTYIELFVRIAVIFFGMEIIKLIPAFVRIIFDSNNSIQADAFTQCIATVILILGILRFCQDAPGLFKELFDTGSGLFSGINFKPGVKNRLEENKGLMWGFNKAASIAGGAVGQFKRQYELNRRTAGNTPVSENRGTAIRHAIPAALRGIRKGMMQKSNQTTLSGSSWRNAMLDSSNAVNKDFYDNERLVRRAENRAQYVHDITQTGDPDSKTWLRSQLDWHRSNIQASREVRQDRREERRVANEYFLDQLGGSGQEVSVSAESLKTITDSIKDIVDNAKTTDLDERITTLTSERNKHDKYSNDRDADGKNAYERYDSMINKLKEERRVARSKQYNENRQARQVMANAVSDITKAMGKSPELTMSDKLKKSLYDAAKADAGLNARFGGRDINSLTNAEFKDILDTTMLKFQDTSVDSSGNLKTQLNGDDMRILDELKAAYADSQRNAAKLQEQNTRAAQAAFNRTQNGNGSGSGNGNSGNS